MNFVDNDVQSELWKGFSIVVYVRMVQGTMSDPLVYLFGC